VEVLLSDQQLGDRTMSFRFRQPQRTGPPERGQNQNAYAEHLARVPISSGVFANLLDLADAARRLPGRLSSNASRPFQNHSLGLFYSTMSIQMRPGEKRCCS